MVYLRDTFTDTAGTTLQAHTPDIGGAWSKVGVLSDAVITVAGRLRYGGLAGAFNGMQYTNAAVPTSADQSISAELRTLLLSPGVEAWRLYTRWDATETGYMAGRANLAVDAAAVKLEKTVNGVLTTLGTYDAGNVPTDGETLTLISAGSAHQILINGVQRVAVTDTSITQVGAHVLFYLNFGAGAGGDLLGLQVDNLEAGALAAVSGASAASFESVVPATTSKVAPLEATARAVAVLTPVFESAVGVARATAALWEGLELATLAASRLAPFEALLAGIDAESQLPAEAQGTATGQAAAALEAIAGMLASRAVVWEALSPTGVLAFRSLPVEAQARAVAGAVTGLESLLPVTLSGGSPFESPLGLAAAAAPPWEAVSAAGVAAFRVLPLEATAALASTGLLPAETLAALTRAAQFPLEAMLSIRLGAPSGFETLESLLAATGSPWETVSAIGVLATVSAPFETVAALALTPLLPGESTAARAVALTVAVEATSALTRGQTVPWEGLSPTGVAALANLPYEVLVFARSLGALQAEASLGLGAARPGPYEAVAAMLAARLAVWEALTPGAVSALAGLPFETLLAATVAADLPFEARGMFAAQVALPFDAAQSVTGQATSPLETALALAALRLLPIETRLRVIAAIPPGPPTGGRGDQGPRGRADAGPTGHADAGGHGTSGHRKGPGRGRADSGIRILNP